MRVSVNWFALLALTVFWSYAFVGVPNSLGDFSWLITLVYVLYFCLAAIPFPFVKKIRSSSFFLPKNLIVPLVFGGVLGILLLLPELNTSLATDELYHGSFSHFWANEEGLMAFRDNPVWRSLPQIYSWYAFDFILMVFLFGCIFAFRKLGWISGLILSFILFVLTLRYSPHINEPHPPMRLFVTWFSSSIFGMTNFSFRIPQFVLALFIGALSYVLANRKGLDKVATIGIAAIVLSTPIVINSGTILEYSITSCAVILTLIALLDRSLDAMDNSNFLGLGVAANSLVAIGALIRQPIIILSVPLSIFLFIHLVRRYRTRAIAAAALAYSPYLAAAPFMYKSFLFGTPATYDPNEAFPFISKNQTLLQRFYYLVQSNTFVDILVRNLGTIWVLFYFATILLLISSIRKHLLRNSWLLSSMVLLFATFFAVRPAVWGVPRYNIEFALPFAVWGMIEFVSYFSKRIQRLIVAPLLVFGVLFNLSAYKEVMHSSGGVNVNIAARLWPAVISKQYWNWDEVIAQIKKNNVEGSYLLQGDLYGPVPQILNGQSFLNITKYQEQVSRYGFDGNKVEQINQSTNINTVYFSGTAFLEKYDYLIAKGWTRQPDILGIHPFFPIIVLTRKID